MNQPYEKYNEVTVPFTLKLVLRANGDDPENGLSEASQAQVIEFVQKLADFATTVSVQADNRPEKMVALLDSAKEALAAPHLTYEKSHELLRVFRRAQAKEHPTLAPFIEDLVKKASSFLGDYMVNNYDGPKESLKNYLENVYSKLVNKGVA